MKVFLTGATGFLGSHFVDLCQANNIKLKILARSKSLNFRIPITLQSTTEVVQKSYSELNPTDFYDIDILVHLAAHSANVPYDSLDNCIYWNVSQPLHMFNSAKTAGVDKFIVTGSCFEYGLSGLSYQYIPANAPLMPTQTYPASKACASVAFTQWALNNQVSLKILRLFQIYGPGELETRLWPSLIKAAQENCPFDMTLGEQLRDFLHVHAVSAILLSEIKKTLASTRQIIYQNVGSGKATSIAEFASNILSQQKSSALLNLGALPYREGEVMRYIPDLKPFIVNGDGLI